MSRVNTKVNTTVNNSKLPKNNVCAKVSTRISTRNQNKEAPLPAKRTRTTKPETPEKEQKNKNEKKNIGKENVRDNKEKQGKNNKKSNKRQLEENNDLDEKKVNNKTKIVTSKPNKKRKIVIPDEDSTNEKNNKKMVVTPQPNKRRKVGILDEDSKNEEDNNKKVTRNPNKKRKIVIPDEDSDSEIDSGDEYKPDDNYDDEESEDEILSEVPSDSEASSEKDSDDETPKKRKVKTNRPAKSVGKKFTKKEEPFFDSEPINAEKASNLQSWPHLKYDFLQPDKIMDSNKHTPDHSDYDPRTLYIPQNFLDKQTPAMRQWWIIKSSHYDCILFFKIGKYYELYHMDAVIGVDELNLTYLKRDFAHTGVIEFHYGRHSSSLIERGYKVARIEQIETPEMAAERFGKMKKPNKFNKIINREICQISTRGTKMYTALDTEATEPTSNYLLSIIEKQTFGLPSYGVCFIDTSIGDFNLGQFQDDRCNSRLLTLLAHYPPVQIIYERGNLSSTTLKVINSFLPTIIKEALPKKDQFKSPSKVLMILQDYFKQKGDSDIAWPSGLQPYFDQDSSELAPLEEKELAVSALGQCVNLLKEYHLDQQLLSRGRFTTYNPPDFTNINKKIKGESRFAHNMVLDAITINNLRILGTDGSLIQVLDNCCTAFGKRLIREWICRPSCRKNVIIERQEAITQLLDNPDIIAEVRSRLSTLPDLERLLSKVHAYGNTCKLCDHPDNRAILIYTDIINKRKIIDFVSLLTGFEEVLKIIEKFSDFTNLLISKCTKLEPEGDFPDLKDKLFYFKNAFNHEKAKENGFIDLNYGVDREYDVVLLELAEIKKESEEYLRKQKKKLGISMEYCKDNKKRFQIEIPENQIKKVGIDYELQGSRKGFKRYHTTETKEFLDRQIAVEEEKDQILKNSNQKIFTQFSEKFDMWIKAAYNVSILDCLITMAEYARTREVCIPTIYDDTDKMKMMIEIKNGKHPCLMSNNFVPNDTFIATDGNAPLILLTGPNMGGKSTLMRQVGLITVMAQIGCHVPASSCRLTLVDRIFTRLGANDDIMAGQSTFLVELSETAAILQHATVYSLVLLDELGRGTSTYDGTAIAASVVNALTMKKCRTLFSTHYHSLVEDFKNNNSVSSAHMACSVENEEETEVFEQNVTFLYKLTKGACPKSYGFNAARLAGIPAKITKRAQEIATKLEKEVKLRYAFTTLCKTNDRSFMKSLLKIVKKY